MAQLDPSRYIKIGSGGPSYGASDGLYWDKTLSIFVIAANGVVKAKFAQTQTTGHVQLSDGTDTEGTALSGDVTVDGSGVTAIGSEKVLPAMLAKPRLRVVEETLTAASLVDGTAAVGTKTLAATIPAGAVFLRSTVTALVGFAGDVSATITLGDGTDADRYNTGTPDIFTTAAAGVDLGAPSGTAFHSAAKAIVATVTSASDITPVLAGGGSCDLKFWFLEPI